MHQMSLPGFYQRLRTDPQRGLAPLEAEQRLRKTGPNTLIPRPRRSALARFLQHLTNLFALLLWAGAILSFMAEWLMPGAGHVYIGSTLVAVVVLNATFSYYQEHKAEAIMAAFHNMLPPPAHGCYAPDGQPSSRRHAWSKATFCCWKKATACQRMHACSR